MAFKLRDRRRGADPPRNESGMGMTDIVSTCDESRISVSSGYGTCITTETFSNCQFARAKRETWHTRFLCPSAAMMFPVPDDKNIKPPMMRGKAGQISSVSFAGVSGVQ